MQDELLWAATWLYMATKKPVYLEYLQEEAISTSVAEFRWDLKHTGTQVLLAKVPFFIILTKLSITTYYFTLVFAFQINSITLYEWSYR